MSIIKDTFSMPDESVIGSTTLQQQEHLDTSNMAKILVIGETGSGKSTYINYLTNYFSRGSLENLRVAIPSKFHLHVTESYPYCEHDIQNSTQSKTYACNQYMFTSNGKQYLFLDTPGLSDTRGAEQDDKNIVKIIDSVENLGGLTAVIIVVNGSVSRLTVNLRNVIARLRGNLPDIVMSNVILVLTNTTRYAANFSISALELSGNIYPYYMQNSAFSQDPSKWTAPVLEALQHDWDQAMDETRAMLHTIDSFKMNSVVAFKQMKEIRNEIKTQMHVARLKVMEIQKMQDQIAAFEAVVKQSNNDLVTYQDYIREREVDKIEIVDAPFHSTLCQNCNHVCHPNCNLDEITTVGAKIFKQCSVISKGNCQQCVHKCSYKVHYHAKKTVQITKQKLQDVLTDIKVMYDQAAKYKFDYQQKITSTADAKKMLEKALSQKNEDIKEQCIELRRLCSGFNIAQELYSFIDQLEVEKAMLRNIERIL
jgi:GTPase Era involved in 16S rRNA processing